MTTPTRPFALGVLCLAFGVLTHGSSAAQESTPATPPAPPASDEGAGDAGPAGPPPPGASPAPASPAPAEAPAPESPPPAEAPAPASPAPAEAPAPESPPPLPQSFERPTRAVVHVAVDYPGAWFETRPLVDEGAWKRVCPAPCDTSVVVDGMEVRVTATGMTASNAFRVEPGAGTARLKVSGGSERARTIGLTLLIAGLPVSFGGMAALGIGSLKDEDGLRTGGIVALSVGAAALLTSLPLLLLGSTSVRNAEGRSIAALSAPSF